MFDVSCPSNLDVCHGLVKYSMHHRCWREFDDGLNFCERDMIILVAVTEAAVEIFVFMDVWCGFDASNLDILHGLVKYSMHHRCWRGLGDGLNFCERDTIILVAVMVVTEAAVEIFAFMNVWCEFDASNLDVCHWLLYYSMCRLCWRGFDDGLNFSERDTIILAIVMVVTEAAVEIFVFHGCLMLCCK